MIRVEMNISPGINDAGYRSCRLRSEGFARDTRAATAKTKTPCLIFLRQGVLRLNESKFFSDYGAGYKIAFTAGSIQLFAATGSKISASAA